LPRRATLAVRLAPPFAEREKGPLKKKKRTVEIERQAREKEKEKKNKGNSKKKKGAERG
jgi:hypothetical protein